MGHLSLFADQYATDKKVGQLVFCVTNILGLIYFCIHWDENKKKMNGLYITNEGQSVSSMQFCNVKVIWKSIRMSNWDYHKYWRLKSLVNESILLVKRTSKHIIFNSKYLTHANKNTSVGYIRANFEHCFSHKTRQLISQGPSPL